MKKILSLLLSIIIIFTVSSNVVLADEEAYASSLAKTNTMIDYLNEVYLNKYPSLAFDIDYCSDDDIELLQAVADYITDGCNSNLDKAEAIYNWMISNISYGDAAFSPIDVYKEREGVCSGQSQLMSTLFKLSGVPSAIVRCSKQGTSDPIVTKEISDEYLTKNLHEFVVAYVDNGWYGYDAVWGSSQPGVWHKMDTSRMADMYAVQHVDGVMPYSDAGWLNTKTNGTDLWYVDGNFYPMYNKQVVERESATMSVGGCLVYERVFWNRGSSAYYTYQGNGSNELNTAFKGGIYLTNYINTFDIIEVKDNGVKERGYTYFNNKLFFRGVDVTGCFFDLGLTNNRINIYEGDIIDLSYLYSGYSISSTNGNLLIDNGVITAATCGQDTIVLSNGTKKYSIDVYVCNFILDELSQSLCDHDHMYTDGDGNEHCMYCGKEIVHVNEKDIEDVVIDEEIVEEVQDDVVDEGIIDNNINETIYEEDTQNDTTENIIIEENTDQDQYDDTNIIDNTVDEDIEEYIDQTDEVVLQDKVEEEIVVQQTEDIVEDNKVEDITVDNVVTLPTVTPFDPANEIIINPILEVVGEVENKEIVAEFEESHDIEATKEESKFTEKKIISNTEDVVVKKVNTNSSRGLLEGILNTITVLFSNLFNSIRKVFLF